MPELGSHAGTMLEQKHKGQNESSGRTRVRPKARGCARIYVELGKRRSQPYKHKWKFDR